MEFLKQKIRSNPKIKWFVHRMLIPSGQARPRTWVKWFVNPFLHKYGKHATIRKRTRMDVMPFRKFVIGAYSTIEDFSTVNNGVGDVLIGSATRIGIGCVIIGPVTIGDSVIMAQNVVVSGLNHGYQDIAIPISKQPTTTAMVIIEEECWIGANAVITAGTSIGKHSVVAAGAIVTKSIPPYSIAAGNPAKVIKKYNFERQSWERL